MFIFERRTETNKTKTRGLVLIAEGTCVPPPPPRKGLDKNELYSTSNSGRQYLLKLTDLMKLDIGIVFSAKFERNFAAL